VTGGESSGAGIEVPSVSEKLMGASVNGLNLEGMATEGGVCCFTAQMSCVCVEAIARRERQEEVSERLVGRRLVWAQGEARGEGT
jgi:hypothetical protein